MTTPLERRGEVLRLARVLGVEPAELDVLEGASTEDLRELRHAVADRLLDRSRDQFSRAVQLGDLVPGALAAKLSQHVMGPVLGGRAAALLTPEKAADLARRLPADFLADVACHVDIRKVQPLLAGIDRRTMADAGAHLRRREEWVVLGAFVGYVPDDVVADLLDGFDGEALLRSGVVIEDTSRLDTVVSMLSDDRLDGLLEAADEHGLWGDITALNVHLGDAQLRRITDAVQRMSGDRIEALAALLGGDDELRDAARPIVERLEPVFLADMAAQVDLSKVGPLLHGIPHETLAEAGAELERRGSWELLGRLMVALDDDVVARLAPAFAAETLETAYATIDDPGRLDALRALVPVDRHAAAPRTPAGE
jgi:hypothetical protein